MKTKLLAVLVGLLPAAVVQAQQDGARGYLLGTKDSQALLFIDSYTSANQSPDHGAVVVGSDITSNVAAVQYVSTFDLGGTFATAFAVLSAGNIDGTVNSGGTILSNDSGGIGDFVLGGTLGLIGMPALSPEQYVAHDPGFAMAALAVVMAPTGAYDSSDIFNLGTNRWAFRVGLPMYYIWGESYLDPEMTTFELRPTLTFYTDNKSPFGARRQSQDPFFELEAHLTRNLNDKLWIAADAIYQYGSETATNGASDDNTRMNVNLGATVGFNISPTVQVRASYSHSVEHNDFGMEGQGGRIMVIWAF